MRVRRLWIVLLCIYSLWYTMILAEETPLVTTKGNTTHYTITLQEESAMLSRDGSTAIQVEHGEIITKPGRYYLTKTHYDGTVAIDTFYIPYTEQTILFNVTNDQEIEEALKQVLEQKTTTFTLQLQYGTYNFEQLSEKIKCIMDLVANKYPALTYDAYTIRTAAGRNPLLTMAMTYPTNAGQFSDYHAEAMAMIPAIINTFITDTMKDYEREWVLFDFMVKHVTYGDTNSAMTHTLEGTLVDQLGVCDGYAQALMYLLNSVGVPTTLVTGSARDAYGRWENHAWNLVEIQNHYYHIDVTRSEERRVGKEC